MVAARPIGNGENHGSIMLADRAWECDRVHSSLHSKVNFVYRELLTHWRETAWAYLFDLLGTPDHDFQAHNTDTIGPMMHLIAGI